MTGPARFLIIRVALPGGWHHELSFAADDIRAALEGRDEVKPVTICGYQADTNNTYHAQLVAGEQLG